MEHASFRLRIAYGKKGRLRYLSHLELIHSQERMIRRAGLPFALTQGFSPHMKLAFGPALPVGCGSDCEYLEVWLTKLVNPDAALALLQDASVAQLMPIKAEYIADDAPSIVDEFTVFEYRAEIDVTELGSDACARVDAAIDAVLGQGMIEVTRKKKTKTILFKDVMVAAPVATEAACGILALEFTLKASERGSLRPDLLLEEIALHVGQVLPLRTLMRTGLRSEE